MKFSLPFCSPFVRDNEAELVIACGQDAERERKRSTVKEEAPKNKVGKNKSKGHKDTKEDAEANGFDYDVDKGELFYHLENKAWDAAITVARACPEQAHYWISRRNPDSSLRWRMLPIHAAIIFDAPSETVRTLLEANPESIQAKDDEGNHPLLLAYSLRRNESVTGVLAEFYVSSSKRGLETKDAESSCSSHDNSVVKKHGEEPKQVPAETEQAKSVPDSSAAVASRSEGGKSNDIASGSLEGTSAGAGVSNSVDAKQDDSVRNGSKAWCSNTAACAAEARDDIEQTKGKQHETAKLEEEAVKYDYKSFDYDADKGEMFFFLENKNWAAATNLTKERPEKARHWIKRKNPEGVQRWRMLPIHCAIIFGAPAETIRALLEAYPEAILAKDDRGIHPLQLAYRLQRGASVTNLLEEYYVHSKTQCWPIKQVENIAI